jgi:hypothetical protein
MQFRDLTENDIPQLLKWLRQFSGSFDYPGKAPISDEVAGLFFSRFINSASEACIVAEANNKPVAVLGFTIMPHPWTGQKILFKAFWYSAKAGAGIKLLRYVIDLSKKGEVELIIAGSMLENSHRIFEAHGFKPCETNYVLDLRN